MRRIVSRLAAIALTAVALMVGLATITTVQATAAAPVHTLVVVPDLDTIETTPVVCRIEQGPADGAFRWEACTPEESPRGGWVTSIEEDGSASYSDGYTISVANEDGTTAGAVLGKWKAPSTDRRAQHA